MSTPPLTPLAAAVLHVGAPERVLSLECGEGEPALFLAREFPTARIRGLDRDQRAIRRARARVGLDPEGRIAFKVGSPRSLPFPEDHFDLVAIVDGAASPAETARVLRPGGYLVLAYTGQARQPNGLGSWLRERRLGRRGIEPIESAPTGDGSFSVGRLGGDGRAGASL